jgi:hypothetical protein
MPSTSFKHLTGRRVRDGRTSSPVYIYWKRVMVSYVSKRANKIDKKWFDFWEFEKDVIHLYLGRVGDIFCRINSSLGWKKDNVWFVKNYIEKTWGTKGVHHIDFEGTKISVREAWNIMKKRGIKLDIQTIRDRVRKEQKIFNSSQQYNRPRDKKTGRFMKIK